MNSEQDLQRQLHDLAESAGPWPDPLRDGAIDESNFHHSRPHRSVVPLPARNTMAYLGIGLAVLVALAIGGVFLIQPTETTRSTIALPGVAARSTGSIGSTAAVLPVTSPSVTGSTVTEIVGRFIQVGGPAPGGQINPVAGSVSAYLNSDGNGRPIATTRADPNGTFRLLVPAGTYYLFGFNSHLIGPSGHGTRVSGGAPIHATLGKVTNAEIAAYIP